MKENDSNRYEQKRNSRMTLERHRTRQGIGKAVQGFLALLEQSVIIPLQRRQHHPVFFAFALAFASLFLLTSINIGQRRYSVTYQIAERCGQSVDGPPKETAEPHGRHRLSPIYFDARNWPQPITTEGHPKTQQNKCSFPLWAGCLQEGRSCIHTYIL